MVNRELLERRAKGFAKRFWSQEDLWLHTALGGILLLATVLNFSRLNRLGYANPYYAATVKSMLLSWQNFFFVSFDPECFVAADKPPLGLWLQALSAKAFGFSGLSLLLPQALAGVLSVALLYLLVRRTSGGIAGLLAALALATTPICVMTNRNNTIDSILVLTTLCAAWALFRATEQGKLRWLLLCAVLVALGFNIKMLQAYLVIPAFALVYLLGAPRRWWVRVLHLILTGVLLLLLSLSWVLAVDLIPASQRPYVGSSQTNSELELAFGYNGLLRLLGLGGQPASTQQPASTSQSSSGTVSGMISSLLNSDETGTPGPLRLFNAQLAGQLSWLLPLALLGLVVASWQASVRLPLSREQQAVLLWGIWLLSMMVFFSIAGFFHVYYLVMLAPAGSALAGIGLVSLWKEYQRSGWRSWLLPLALLLTLLVQSNILSPHPELAHVLVPMLAVLGLCAVVVLVVARAKEHTRLHLLRVPALWFGVLALLIAPTTWSTLSLLSPSTPTQALIPKAEPEVFRLKETPASEHTAENSKLLQFLLARQGKTRFLVATLDALTAAPIMLSTAKSVMALGGFLGIDPIVTPEKLALLIKNDAIHYFLLPSFQISRLPPQIRKALTTGDYAQFGVARNLVAILSWVNKHCAPVPARAWRTKTPHGNAEQSQGIFGAVQEQLYYCGSSS